MRLIDEEYTRHPFYGSRRMTTYLRRLGHPVNRKRISRLMRLMNIEAIYPKPKTSQRNAQHKIYPYLLRDLRIEYANQVWSSDITYIPMQQGFMYLVAIIDWFSRYVLTWQLSNTLVGRFCCEALELALSQGQPEIFNTDQGSQFTSTEFTSRLEEANVEISMDGRGRCLDNIFIERFWRSLKYEDIYIKDYASVSALYEGVKQYIRFYNTERPHQSLTYKTPYEVHYGLD